MIAVARDAAIGLFFVGIFIGLLIGLVIHDAFKAWDEYRSDEYPDDPRKPW